MKEITTREKILNRIRNASLNKYENPFGVPEQESSVYTAITESEDITFAQEFSKLGGKFIYCENDRELSLNLCNFIIEKKWKKVFCPDPGFQKLIEPAGISVTDSSEEMKECIAGITGCEFMIARTGSILVSSGMKAGRQSYVYPEVHIVIGYISQVVRDLKDALNEMRKKYDKGMPSLISMISGPSRTADIEKTLVMGAHGPKELYVFLTEK